ncbi:MAG TPA: nickel pincer cofactor biosynthesis protein LarB [Acidimicrobiales bacterium]|nr:nickel pincer cofactor biosynthesis protein LarB [Acidimicrobiales bacterium]
MDEATLRGLLEDVAAGRVLADEAVGRLRRLPFADLGFAKVDHHRHLRQGRPEAVYGPGKTPAQASAIVAELLADPSGGPVLLTRAGPEQAEAALAANPGGVSTPAQPATMATLVWRPNPGRPERVVVVTAGTADLPVAAEAQATLAAYGFAPCLLADCGVAGLHRLLGSIDVLQGAQGVIVVAGMEGALASIVGGLTGAPVVAVPTSVGYGAALEGVTALLAMLSSCAAGLTVVGIDNGFGAASALGRMLDTTRPDATPTDATRTVPA